mgnify:CR=1 FL=1
MAEYILTPYMRRILKLQSSIKLKRVCDMSQEEIDKLSTAKIPNNRLTRRLLAKPAENILKKTLQIPVEDSFINGYLFTKMEHPNQKRDPVRFDRPLIIYFHGGGWVIGHTILNDFFCRRIASITDSVVLSVDYRLAPAHKFPTAVTDATAALLWAKRHASAWGASKDKIFTMGSSAGGNLAAVIGLREHHAITGEILIYPVTDGRMQTPSYTEHEFAPQLDKKLMDFFINSYKRTDDDILDPDFSPLLSEHAQKAPPTLIITAEYDPLHDDGILYGKKLEESGISVTYLECKKTIHGFINYPDAQGVALVEEAVSDFIMTTS